ncbi:MAG: adenylate kinase [Lachnospiraceae bacterium]|nr:adenylate kinase [Lachnospiraceae bacterium]
MKIVLLGAPGAGKGTHAQYLSDKYEIPHISTGDIFRANLKEGTPLGLKAKAYMDRGELVPDELTVDLVLDRLMQDDCANGYILDGFPRNLFQAEALTKALAEKGEEIDHAIHFVISEEAILRRMSGRRVCPVCGASYNIVGMPTKVEGICDRCGSEVIQREDDKPATVLKRLEVYREQTEPIVGYYRERGKEERIDSAQPLEAVREALDELLKEDGHGCHSEN